MLDYFLGRLNKNARIVLCGAISAYNTKKPRGLQAYLNLISQRASLNGFIVSVSFASPRFHYLLVLRCRYDYAKDYPRAEADIAGWIKDGKMKRKFHYESGLEKCPEHLGLLYSGGNTGKL